MRSIASGRPARFASAAWHPIALKDNIHTTHMPPRRRAGVRGLVPPYEATLTKNLRDGGAIILAKPVTELATGWPAHRRRCDQLQLDQGYGFNPTTRAAIRVTRRRPSGHDHRRLQLRTGTPRTSGPRTSAPRRRPSQSANAKMLAAVKRPSDASRVTASFRSPRPGHARSDGAHRHRRAILLGVLEGADRSIPPPRPARRRRIATTRSTKRDGLKGARIGIPRAFYYDKFTAPSGREGRNAARRVNPDQLKHDDASPSCSAGRGDRRSRPTSPNRRPGAEEQPPDWGVCTDLET